MFLYLLGKVNWIRFFRLLRGDAEDVVWLRPGSVPEFLRYLREMHTVIYDLAVISCLIGAGRPFRLRFGLAAGDLRGKKVHFTLSREFNPLGLADYTKYIFDAVGRLERGGNTVFPSRAEALWWENKAYMHERFAALGIRHPETFIVRKGDVLPDVKFPVLFKEVHSAGSHGVFKLESAEELASRVGAAYKGGQDVFLLQKLVNMRSDLRVIIIGDRIALHYWRKNVSGEWRPTSTGRGSVVDFGNFPERWRGYILDNFRKLGLRTGAFDITWENDDISSEPFFLEVSPVYQPNPAPPPGCADIPYSDYKKKIFIRESYFVKYIDTIFLLKKELYRVYLADTAVRRAGE